MKVLHLISGGDTGGAKTHVHSLLYHLGREIPITMVCFMDGPFAEEAREMGIDTRVFAGQNIFRVRKQLLELVRTEGYDMIHCHGARGNMMGIMLRKAAGLPIISTVHSDYKLDYLGRPLSRLTFGTINAAALRRMDYRIGVSDAMVDQLIERGFPPNSLFAIYNGLDFSPRTPSMTRQAYLDSLNLPWPEDAIIVGIAARLNPVKDIATLIRGFSIARQDCPNLRLLIAGDGAELDMLQGLATSLHVSEDVCFAGWVTEIDNFYCTLDINTLTSLSETFPYALTEGARAHLPTVSSRVGGVPYFIEDGVNGLLFEAGDEKTLGRHLKSLYESAELRQRYGERLYETGLYDYSIEKTIQTQLTIYETILRRQARKKADPRDGILICGAYGRGNAGDDAILEAILKETRALDYDRPVTVLSRHPSETKLRYRVNSIYTFNVFQFRKLAKKSRLYINGGGSLMQDVTSSRSLWFYLYTLRSAKKHGAKVLMYGCGIGPIQHESNRRMTANIVDRYVDTITLRDTHSKSELDQMGVIHPDIILSADPTVILSPAKEDAIDSLMLQNGLEVGGKYISFTVRPWPGFDEKAAAFAAAADYAYQTYGLTPVFIPIEPRIDLGAAEKVIRLMKSPSILVQKTGDSSHTIGLYSRMSIAVSIRLHALVFSAGQGVPLVGVVYDHKVSSFLSYIGQDLYCDLQTMQADELCKLIDSAAKRIDDETFLSESVALLREIEARNSQAAQALLSGGDET